MLPRKPNITSQRGKHTCKKKYETVWVYIFHVLSGRGVYADVQEVSVVEQETPTYFREDDYSLLHLL